MKIDLKILLKAMSFMFLPTLAVLLVVYFWFFNFAAFVAFVTASTGWAGFLRVVLMILEVVCVVLMYRYLYEEAEKAAELIKIDQELTATSDPGTISFSNRTTGRAALHDIGLNYNEAYMMGRKIVGDIRIYYFKPANS